MGASSSNNTSSSSSNNTSSGLGHREIGFNQQIDHLVDFGKLPPKQVTKSYTFYTVFGGNASNVLGGHQAVIITFNKDGTTWSFRIELCKNRSNIYLKCSDVVRSIYGRKDNWEEERTIVTTITNIKQAANDVIQSFGAYNVASNNCQHFANRFMKKLGAIGDFRLTKVSNAKISLVGAPLAGVAAGAAVVECGVPLVPAAAVAYTGLNAVMNIAGYND